MELEANVALDDAQVRSAVDAWLKAPSLGATRTLGAVLADRARLDVRTYAEDEDTTGIGGNLAAGAKVGGSYDKTVTTRRLLSAATRPPGGFWERRTDCEGEA
jgi:hypothetical protein